MAKAPQYDTIVVGGGPAGLTAAMYAARARLRALLITKSGMGGQAATTLTIDNYPGFPQGTTGPELGRAIAAQAERFGAQIARDEVLELDLQGEPKTVRTKKLGTLSTRTIILAPGTQPRTLNVPGEGRLRGRGVSYCATCDADLYSDEEVAVIGNGDAAVEEGLYLTRFAKRVWLVVVHEEGTLDATPVIRERAFANERMGFIWNSVLEEIVGDEVVEEIILGNIATGEKQRLPVAGVFIFIGATPQTEFLAQQIELNQSGYIVTGQDMSTSVPGVFAAGDACQKYLRQVVTAAADGAVAAVAAEKFVREEEWLETVFSAPGALLVVCWSPAVRESYQAVYAAEQAAQNTGTRVVKLDLYRHRQLAGRLQVDKPPAILVVQDGTIAARLCGDFTADGVMESLRSVQERNEQCLPIERKEVNLDATSRQEQL
ncbi:MAG TPA: thioredoxin-disulfide reductase [Firmicutes bacterium]|jgi:thioredoxin reductase (NADPH)|nr:thioredoxin-disulfide reductase [Bacillota bacterium]